MANNWFQFKQFRIEQDRCAMKVGTDGVLLGAWSTASEGPVKAIDIGSGTGLLALMLAQKNPLLYIDAIEIDPDAASQAEDNIKQSPFWERIHVFNLSFQEFLSAINKKTYDLIICNPPYFQDSYKGIDNERNIARHSDSLSLEILFKGVYEILADSGHFGLIIPSRYKDLTEFLAAQTGLFITRRLDVIPAPGKKASRHCYEFSKLELKTKISELIIESGGRHHYSEEFRQLTSPFYL